MTTENVQSAGIVALDNLYGQMVLPTGINQPAAGVPQGVGFAGQGSRQTSKGVAVHFKRVQGFVTPTNGATAPSWYQFCRMPSDAVLLGIEMILASGTITTFTGDLTAGYSDAFDGTPFSVQVAGVPSGLSAAPANALILNPAGTTTGLSGSQALFAQAFAFSGLTAKVWTEMLFNNGLFGQNFQNFFDMPLWQFAGFPADPRANIDIGVLTTQTNSVSSPVLGMRVAYLQSVAG
jgi:hypothetical protein